MMLLPCILSTFSLFPLGKRWSDNPHSPLRHLTFTRCKPPGFYWYILPLLCCILFHHPQNMLVCTTFIISSWPELSPLPSFHVNKPSSPTGHPRLAVHCTLQPLITFCYYAPGIMYCCCTLCHVSYPELHPTCMPISRTISLPQEE